MKIVIALGGNALGNNPREQVELVRQSSKAIVDLVEEGHQVVIVHGNGPQVGMINMAFEESKKTNNSIPHLPFAECNAMSQGYIGYHLQNAIGSELKSRGQDKSIATILTQVLVDKDDKAFDNPSKPIGGFYSRDEAEKIEKETSYIFKEDAGRGYRRVVPSPMPVDIVEIDMITTLVENNHIVIAVGGGGIPVYREGENLLGIDAVIDKDFASCKLAEKLEADYLIILTAVDEVAIHYGRPNQEWLYDLDIWAIDRYIEEGHFAPGSMLPKIQAAKEFALSKKGRKALITSLDRASEAIKGKRGTRIEDK